MPQAKKFGTFAGVFTPSILTILGVIMYMRLGWVVGQSGLYTALGIIIIAHIISITTGLSVSSIATDKKVKAGGIYYILSRSLGLPMGGSIGITLFIGTALSIALYIVGFCESFFGVEAISNFLGMEGTVSDIRIVGTIIITILVITAFISTSLAIKTQFFILAAIFLSLVSIAVGFFTNTNFHPETANITMNMDAPSVETIFAIFFPAVTGFTAGVAMSGDLKDPKKGIPVGTLLAIGVGLVVYILLAVGLALFVDRDLLLNDRNFLLKVAWISPLVIAGIWGATLSSALGGILGGPRILQALSTDRIMPRFMGKGHGESNEPRNALLVTFLIAEAGILIGELDTIARVVSMFYIAAYGFINVAYALESWASSDFRPSFRISRWIGVVGFIAAFIVMFRLDFMAMIIAFVFMWLIYFLLQKRELQLDFGDVWQSVWSNIVRTSLHKMDQKDLEERNWRPNIILFSGATRNRPHLIEFGKWLVGKHGFLSNFDLIKSDTKRITYTKEQQGLQTEDSEQYKGIFTRRQTVNDIYEGIENIAQTYGFAGVEPNTVMLGWARQSKKPIRFAQTLKTISDLDLNIIAMDYDKRVGFGNHKTIDIWWRGHGNNGNLALQLLKFIWLSNEWRDAKARLMIVNPINEEEDQIRKEAQEVLDNLRIYADIKIINNKIEQKSFYDIVKVESIHTDLIFMGIPDIEQGQEKEFVRETNDLCHDIGTVVLIKAASHFKNLELGVSTGKKPKLQKEIKGIDLIIAEEINLPEVNYPEQIVAQSQLKEFKDSLDSISKEFAENNLAKAFKYHEGIIDEIKKFINTNFFRFEKVVTSRDSKRQKKFLETAQSNLLLRNRLFIENLRDKNIDLQEELLSIGIKKYFSDLSNIIRSQPKKIVYTFTKEELKAQPGDTRAERMFKFRLRTKGAFAGDKVRYTVRFKKLVLNYFPFNGYKFIYDVLNNWGKVSAQYIIEIQKFIRDTNEIFLKLQKARTSNQLDDQLIIQEKQNVSLALKELEQLNKDSFQTIYKVFLKGETKLIQQLSDNLSKINPNKYIVEDDELKSKVKKLSNRILSLPGTWKNNQSYFYNATILEFSLMNFSTNIKSVFSDIHDKVSDKVNSQFLLKYKQLIKFLEDYDINQVSETSPFEYNFEPVDLNEISQFFRSILEETLRKTKTFASQFPESVVVMNDESLNSYTKLQYKNIETVTISVSRLLDYLIQIEIIEPLQNEFEILPEKYHGKDINTQDIIRLISFTLQQSTDDPIEDFEGEINPVEFFEGQKQKVQSNHDILLKLKEEFELVLEERLNAVINKLSYASFTQTAQNLKQYVKGQESRKRLVKVSKRIFGVSRFFNNILGQLWYRQSRGILLAKRLKSGELQSQARVSDFLNLLDEVKVKKEVVNQLPFYYQQLFLRKSNYLSEFWVGRDRELKKAEKAINRYKNGFLGGILVTGERKAGKTFLSNYMVRKFYPGSKTYTITPPTEGSIKPLVFKNTLKKTLDVSGGYKDMFSQIPENSTVIFDDIELWWEKSMDGFKVLDEIISIIEEFSNKCLFIANCNTHSFNFINKIKHIESSFLSIIECEPLNAEQMKEAIMIRHRSSDMNFKIGRISENNMLAFHQARLFNKHFTYSKGNIGIALQNWIACVNEG
jgi:amino acid transporter